MMIAILNSVFAKLKEHSEIEAGMEMHEISMGEVNTLIDLNGDVNILIDLNG